MITREELTRAKIFPINVEDYVREFLNDNYEEVEVMNSKYRAGDVIKAMDPIKFNVIVLDEIAQHVAEEIWTEIDGLYYSRYELMCHLGLDD